MFIGMDNTDLVKRAQQAKSDRQVVQQSWDAIREFVLPYRGNFFEENNSEGAVDWYQARNNFDSTASGAHATLASSLHANITNPSTRWFMLQFRNKDLNEMQIALKWLQSASDAVWWHLQDSSWNLEVDEFYQDISGYGSAFMTLEETRKGNKFEGFDFTSVPLKEGFFDQDHKGRVLYFYRRLRWTSGQILSKFGTDGVPESIIKADADGSNEKFTIWFCIYPRSGNGIRQTTSMGEKLSPAKRPWGSKYILEDDSSLLGKEGGYYDMPVYCGRWRKTSDSIWGNGPAHMVLGDILSLNRAAEVHENISVKMADIPLMAEERALLGDLNLKDSNLLVVRKLSGLAPMPMDSRPETLFLRMDALQTSIRTHFYTDQLQFPPAQGTPMSATEAQIRYEMIQKLLGPTLGRIQNDILTPVVSRAFRMLLREKVIPPPPEQIRAFNPEIDIHFLGPLARAQRLDNLVAKERYVAFAANIDPVFPTAKDVVDIDKVMRDAAIDLSLDADNTRSKDDVQIVRDERDAKQAAMEEALIKEQQGVANQAQQPTEGPPA